MQGQDEVRVGLDSITFRVTSRESGGALVAADVRIPAGGGPPALHRHDPTEVYRVETGELALYVEDDNGTVRRLAAGPGDVVHIPGRRRHTVRNESAAEALAYVVFTPGAEMEAFLREAGALAERSKTRGHRPLAAADQDPPPIEDVLALAERHGIEMTGPVPSPA